ncbi:hypothetical protein MHK_006646, partial [Candidatus Magnetomorum sp. HK-1]
MKNNQKRGKLIPFIVQQSFNVFPSSFGASILINLLYGNGNRKLTTCGNRKLTTLF